MAKLPATHYCYSTDGEPLVLFRSGWSVFSNFNIMKMKIDNQDYNCVEQWYQSEKAKYFKDDETYAAIMKARSPKLQKQLAKDIKGFSEEEWRKVACDVMRKGLTEKMKQGYYVHMELFGTLNGTIAEASEFDSYWGIGISMNDKDVYDKKCWKGDNWLGKLWMELRDSFYANKKN